MVQSSYESSGKINESSRKRASIESDIINWITEKLSVKREEFGGMSPCPFAHKTLLEKKLLVIEPPLDIVSVEELLSQQEYEVVIYYYDPKEISATELSLKCNEINESYPDIVALEDHPDEPEDVAGYSLNQGTWALILIQHRHKLEQAREKLKLTDYYRHWSAEYLSDVLGC